MFSAPGGFLNAPSKMQKRWGDKKFAWGAAVRKFSCASRAKKIITHGKKNPLHALL